MGTRIQWTELRWGMRDAQRGGACDGNETDVGGLHPKGEPDTFYCSHGLPLIQATLVRGAFVLIARVRPVLFLFLACFLKSILLVSSLPSVGYLGQQLPNSLNFLFGPVMHSHTAQCYGSRCGYFIRRNVAT